MVEIHQERLDAFVTLEGYQMKKLMMAVLVLGMMAGVAGAENTSVGPHLSLDMVESNTAYVLNTQSGERRVLLGKTLVGIDTLVNLITKKEEKVLLERNDPTTLTLVVASPAMLPAGCYVVEPGIEFCFNANPTNRPRARP